MKLFKKFAFAAVGAAALLFAGGFAHQAKADPVINGALIINYQQLGASAQNAYSSSYAASSEAKAVSTSAATNVTQMADNTIAQTAKGGDGFGLNAAIAANIQVASNSSQTANSISTAVGEEGANSASTATNLGQAAITTVTQSVTLSN